MSKHHHRDHCCKERDYHCKERCPGTIAIAYPIHQAAIPMAGECMMTPRGLECNFRSRGMGERYRY